MSQPGSRDDHFERLGPFVLGALPLDEHLAVEEHVAQCPHCQVVCSELSEGPAILSTLAEEDVRTLRVEFASQRNGRTTTTHPPFAAAERSAAVVRQAPPSMPRRSSRPDGSPPGHRPRHGRSIRNRVAASLPSGARGRVLLASIVVTLALGIGIGTWVQISANGPVVPITLAAAATNEATGASASIVVTGRDNGAHVEAKLGGLQAGVQYELIAASVRGQTEVAARWIGVDGQSTIVADLSRPPNDWAFFTVAELNGTVVVSVRVTAVTSTP